MRHTLFPLSKSSPFIKDHTSFQEDDLESILNVLFTKLPIAKFILLSDRWMSMEHWWDNTDKSAPKY